MCKITCFSDFRCGSGPSSLGLGGWMAEVRGQNIFSCFEYTFGFPMKFRASSVYTRGGKTKAHPPPPAPQHEVSTNTCSGGCRFEPNHSRLRVVPVCECPGTSPACPRLYMLCRGGGGGSPAAPDEGAARSVHMGPPGQMRLAAAMSPDARVRCTSPPPSVPSPGATLCSVAYSPRYLNDAVRAVRGRSWPPRSVSTVCWHGAPRVLCRRPHVSSLMDVHFWPILLPANVELCSIRQIGASKCIVM